MRWRLEGGGRYARRRGWKERREGGRRGEVANEATFPHLQRHAFSPSLSSIGLFVDRRLYPLSLRERTEPRDPSSTQKQPTTFDLPSSASSLLPSRSPPSDHSFSSSRRFSISESTNLGSTCSSRSGLQQGFDRFVHSHLSPPPPWFCRKLTISPFLLASTVFQQIDIEEYLEPGAGPSLRIFGVTQVCPFVPSIRSSESGGRKMSLSSRS